MPIIHIWEVNAEPGASLLQLCVIQSDGLSIDDRYDIVMRSSLSKFFVARAEYGLVKSALRIVCRIPRT